MQPHPVDTHSLLGHRLKALSVDLDDIPREDIEVPQQSSIGLVGDCVAIQERLTFDQEHFVIALQDLGSRAAIQAREQSVASEFDAAKR